MARWYSRDTRPRRRAAHRLENDERSTFLFDRCAVTNQVASVSSVTRWAGLPRGRLQAGKGSPSQLAEAVGMVSTVSASSPSPVNPAISKIRSGMEPSVVNTVNVEFCPDASVAASSKRAMPQLLR